MKDEEKKISANRQKKIGIVTELSEKFGKANAVVFTNYRGITHKQLEGFKKAIKPLKAEYVVAKNSLLTLALSENKYKLEEGHVLDGQTGTLFLYDDVITPLKALAKTIKELNLPSVKFGIMDKDFVTGEQVLKLSTLPTKEVLLSQLVGTLKGPIFGLHRALNWNLQKLVMTLNAVAGAKPALAVASIPTASVVQPITDPTPTAASEPESSVTNKVEPEPETILAETKEEKALEQTEAEAQPTSESTTTSEPEPETILAETAAEVAAEMQETDNPTIEVQKNESPNGDNKKPQIQEISGTTSSDGDNKGGEN